MSGRKPKLSELALALDKLTWCEVKYMSVQLGMDYSKLEQIEEEKSGLRDKVLNAMDTWLNSDKAASWQKLINALKYLKKTVLAEEVEKDYCHTTDMPASTISVPSTIPAASNDEGERYFVIRILICI